MLLSKHSFIGAVRLDSLARVWPGHTQQVEIQRYLFYNSRSIYPLFCLYTRFVWLYHLHAS
jgi:hypothetical protein